MAMAHPSQAASAGQDISIRTITFDDLRVALRQGWDDFLAKRGDLVFIGFIYPIIVALAIMSASRMSILPLIFPLVAGAILLGPAFASGFYELARRREAGLDARWRHFLDVIRKPGGSALFDLTCVLALLFMAWMATAWFIYHATLENVPGSTSSVGAFLSAIFGTSQGWQMIVLGNLVGFGFALLTLAVSVVSFPMAVDKPVSWGVAMRTSCRVAWHNPVTVATWGLIVVALLVLGALPALVGLAVVLPVLGYATWHLYTRAVIR
ncbi:DUF2189 domain-containing protein [Sphingobium fuliginis]|uniref:DUF2189 domain-containing protein n=1 Tax=Sphingobium fuliginis (strain ATCC 27551) TaxID=336203 RepID=A0A292ZNN2_SPHSA|nr:DUF2189 domain-containing protein [Sphingobium fuliginis]GAY24594.1 hypothetical protein SFOMI_5174 [Sphingobium fuliginis]